MYYVGAFLCISAPEDFLRGSALGFELKAHVLMGISSASVVMWVINAKFLTRPQASPSGVSDGQSIPHCDG